MERGKYAFTSADYLQTGYEVKHPLEKHEIERDWQATATDILRKESSIAAWREHDRQEFEDKRQEGFEVYEDFPEHMIPFTDRFRGVGSLEERDFVMNQITSEMNRAKRISEAGGGEQFFWSMMGYLGSPEVYPLLFANPLRGASTFVGGALKLGGVASAETAIHEGVMHKMQETRNWKETAINVGGAALLGGTLGGLIARLGGGRYRAALNEADDDLRTIAAQDGVDVPQGSRGGGAEAVTGTLAEEAPVHPPRVTTKGFTIFHRLSHARVAEAHKTVNEFFQHTLSIGKNHKTIKHRAADGTITEESAYVPKVEALETVVEREESALFISLQNTLHKNFKAYSDKNRVWKGRLGGWMGKNKSWKQFNEELMYALRNNDKSASGDAAVDAAAAAIRSDIMDVIKKFAVDEDRLPEDVVARFAESFVPRKYNRLGMKARPEQFKQMTVEYWTPKWLEAKRTRLLDASARQIKKARSTAPEEIETTLREARERLSRAEVDSTFDESIQLRREELIAAGKPEEAKELMDLKALGKHVRKLERERAGIKKATKDSSELEANIRKAEGRLKRSKKPETIKKIKKELAGMRKQLKAIRAARKAKVDEIAQLKAERQALKTREMALDEEELESLRAAADDSYNKIMDGDVGEPMHAMPSGGSALKERVFDVHDNVLAANDFLVNDVQAVLQSHIRSTLRPVMMTAKAGDAEMVDVLKNVQKAYDAEARALHAAGKVDEADSIANEATETLGLLQVARDRFYHRNSHHATNNVTRNLGMLSRQLRRLNLTRMLGGVTPTSLADPVRMKISRTVMFAFKGDKPTYLKALKTIKYNREAFDKAGIAAETASMSRTAAMMDASHMDTSVNKVDEFTRRASNTFMRSTLLGGWTDFMKRWAAAAAQDNMWLEMRRYGDLSHARKVFMAEQGFGPGEVKRVLGMLDEFGEELPHGGTAFNWDDWTDREMANRVMNAIFRESETQIVSPGALDRPSWADNEAGRSILQFKSFSLAANNQVTLRLLDRAKTDKAEIPEAVNILVQQTLGGMVVTASKMILAGKAAEFEDMTMAEWVMNGIDRGGVVPMYTEGFNMVDMMTNNYLTSLAGSPPMRRYDRRNPLSVLGPTMGTVGDMMAMSQAFSDGSWSESDARLMRRLIPYNNLFYLRQLADWAEGRYE